MSLIRKYVSALEWLITRTLEPARSSHIHCNGLKNFTTVSDIVWFTLIVAFVGALFSWWVIPLRWVGMKIVYREGDD